MNDSPQLTKHALDDQDYILMGTLPASIYEQFPSFEVLWDLHPVDYYRITIMGKEIPTPRWQQAYGFDYAYSGARQQARPINDALRPIYTWSQTHLHPDINGLLLNWYDGKKGHYIGAHRDPDLVKGSPIVTLSLGEERLFRFRQYGQKGNGYQDFLVKDGTLLLIPWATNQRWTHEVPRFKRYQERRLSITLRAHLPQ